MMGETMTSEPSVTVIIAAYNAAAYIDQALDSVLAQYSEEEAEKLLRIILVDDASSDETGTIMDRFAAEHPGIAKGLHNDENMGVASSRNRAINLAETKYIAFLDADDYWTPGKLKAQVAVLEQSDAVITSTARELIRADGMSTGVVIPVKNTITYDMLLHTNSISCSSVLARTEVVKEFGMEHDELHEDYILWLRILNKYGDCIGINEPYLKSRMSPDGKSRNKWRSARMQMGVYRLIGIPFPKAIRYFISYAVNGVIKYNRHGKREEEKRNHE